MHPGCIFLFRTENTAQEIDGDIIPALSLDQSTLHPNGGVTQTLVINLLTLLQGR